MDISHEKIINMYDTYITENDKFESGNKAAGTRARKALSELSKLCKERRQEIQNQKVVLMEKNT